MKDNVYNNFSVMRRVFIHSHVFIQLDRLRSGSQTITAGMLGHDLAHFTTRFWERERWIFLGLHIFIMSSIE